MSYCWLARFIAVEVSITYFPVCDLFTNDHRPLPPPPPPLDTVTHSTCCCHTCLNYTLAIASEIFLFVFFVSRTVKFMTRSIDDDVTDRAANFKVNAHGSGRKSCWATKKRVWYFSLGIGTTPYNYGKEKISLKRKSLYVNSNRENLTCACAYGEDLIVTLQVYWPHRIAYSWKIRDL